MKWEAPRGDDAAVVAAQLQRQLLAVPGGIVQRCSRDCPQVVATAPLLADGQDGIFPTLFWLTCPRLAGTVARLEADGWLARLQGLLDNDMEFRDALLQAHQEYAYLRRRTLGRDAYAQLRERAAGRAAVIDGTGVGGSRDMRHLKCLHAHYAHYLATKANPVGRMLDAVLRTQPSARCRECRPTE